MQIDKKDFKDQEKKSFLDKNKEETNRNVKILRQAAIKSKWLVSDSKWDTYLTWIQADIESLEKMVDESRGVLEDPAVVGYEELMKAKTVLLESKAMISSLSIAISYPSQIIKGKKALEDRQKDLSS